MRVSMRLLLPLLYLHRCFFSFRQFVPRLHLPVLSPPPPLTLRISPRPTLPVHVDNRPSRGLEPHERSALPQTTTVSSFFFLSPLPLICYLFLVIFSPHDVSLHSIFYPPYDYKTAYSEKNCFISELNMK